MRSFVVAGLCVVLAAACANGVFAEDAPNPQRSLRIANQRIEQLRAEIQQARESGRNQVARMKNQELQNLEKRVENARRSIEAGNEQSGE